MSNPLAMLVRRCISGLANHSEYRSSGLMQPKGHSRFWFPPNHENHDYSYTTCNENSRDSRAAVSYRSRFSALKNCREKGYFSFLAGISGNRAHVGKCFATESSEGHKLTHVDARGRASMVDVSRKTSSWRVATASAVVFLGKEAFDLVSLNRSVKGDVLTVAQIAGINAAKNTHNLIPLCHQLLLRNVDVRFTMDPRKCAVVIFASARTEGQTGVEMEALTAASVASLTVYDMCKAVTRELKISEVKLESKTGGKHDYFGAS